MRRAVRVLSGASKSSSKGPGQTAVLTRADGVCTLSGRGQPLGLCNGKDWFLDTCLAVTAGASSRGQVHGSCGGPSGWYTLLLQRTHPLAVCTVLEVPKCRDYP